MNPKIRKYISELQSTLLDYGAVTRSEIRIPAMKLIEEIEDYQRDEQAKIYHDLLQAQMSLRNAESQLQIIQELLTQMSVEVEEIRESASELAR